MTALIAGVLRLDGGRADEGRVRAMVAAMCPADCASVVRQVGDGPIAMGVVTLAPAGAGAAEAPVVSDSADALSVADLRLDDPAALALRLGEGSERGSTALVEAAWQAWGADAPGRIGGDFALARWDRTAHRLHLARDPLGVRPLLWAHRPGEWFAFASLPGALLRTGLAARTLDPGGVAELVVDLLALAPRTPFAEIRSLPAAHRLEIGLGGRPRLVQHWRLDPRPRLPFDSNPAEIAVELHRLLDQAVRRRLPSNGAWVGHLSGGLDSGTIAALAARVAGEQGRRYHALAFCEAPDPTLPPPPDEAAFIAEIAHAWPEILVHPVPSPAVADWIRGGTDPDTALSTAPDHPEERAVATAAGLGARSILTGWGGDQMLTHSGSGAHAELFWNGAWSVLMRDLRALRSSRSVPLWRLALPRLLLPSLPKVPRAWLRRRLIGRTLGETTRDQRCAFLAPALRHMLAPVPVVDGIDTQASRMAEIEAPYLAARFEAFARHGARHGVRYVHPLVDLDLLAYAVRVPGIFLCRNGLPRRLIRDAMAGHLPDAVRLRRDKRDPYPTEALRTASTTAEMMAECARLAQARGVAKFLDLEEVSAYLAAGPDADTVLRAMARADAGGAPVGRPRLVHIEALHTAHFLGAQPE